MSFWVGTFFVSITWQAIVAFVVDVTIICCVVALAYTLVCRSLKWWQKRYAPFYKCKGATLGALCLTFQLKRVDRQYDFKDLSYQERDAIVAPYFKRWLRTKYYPFTETGERRPARRFRG